MLKSHTILYSTINIIGGVGGGLLWPFNEYKTLYYDNEGIEIMWKVAMAATWIY